MHIGVRLGPRGWPFAELVASWRAAEEVGFGFVSCADQLTAQEGGPTWDAPSLLAVMAASTSDIPLAIHVVNTSLRDPIVLAAQVTAAQALSGGRVTVGLGAGPPREQRERQGTGATASPWRDRVARLDAFCRALPALWRGHAVSHSQLGLRDARLGPTGIHPPSVVVGGSSDAVLGVAARHADVWNGIADHLDDFAARASRLGEIIQGVERDHDVAVEALVHVDAYVVGREWDSLRAHLERLAEMGTNRVVLSLDHERGPDAVHRLGEAVGQDRRDAGAEPRPPVEQSR